MPVICNAITELTARVALTSRAGPVFLHFTLVATFGLILLWGKPSYGQASIDALVAKGQPALAAVESLPHKGDRHLERGEPYDYGEPFPVSGPMDPRPTPAGFYTKPQPMTELVHALEHGNVVVYFGTDPAAMGDLFRWTSKYRGDWDGLIAHRNPELRSQYVLAAWRQRLTLASYDAAAVVAFIDRFRGRGPERPVR